MNVCGVVFFFSSRRRHTRWPRDWSSDVCSSDLLAIERGVEVGMDLATAAALCRDLQWVPYKEALESQKLQEIARWLYDLSADIVLYPPDGLLLKVSSMLKFYAGLMPYWLSVQTLLNALPYRYHYATGRSPLAAQLLAKAGECHISEDAQKLKQRYDACSI